MNLLDLLPILRSFAQLTTDVASREAESAGRPVRCGPHCGACCRQLVPIAPVEALDLRDTIDALTPEHRDRVKQRFHQAKKRLAKTGMLTRLEADRVQVPAPQGARRRLGLEYFALGLPCPFLEQESCSIHPNRPLACREYLVSSDPVHCAQPSAESVMVVQLPRRLSQVLATLGAELSAEPSSWLPLVLALDDERFDPRALRNSAIHGPALFERLISLLLAGPGHADSGTAMTGV